MWEPIQRVDDWISVDEWLESLIAVDIWKINRIDKIEGFSNDMISKVTSLCKPLYRLFKESLCHGNLRSECRFNRSTGKFSIGNTNTQFSNGFIEDIKFVREFVEKLITKYPAPGYNAETVKNLAIVNLFFSMCDEAIESESLEKARYFGLFAIMNPLFLDMNGLYWFSIKAQNIRNMHEEFDQEFEKFCKLDKRQGGNYSNFAKFYDDVEKYKKEIYPIYEVSKMPDDLTGVVVSEWKYLGQVLLLYTNYRYDSHTFKICESIQQQHETCWLVLSEGHAALWYFMALFCANKDGYPWDHVYKLDYIDIMINQGPYIWNLSY